MNKIKVVIVDDELTSRNTIKGLLSDSAEYEVVADFSGGRQALGWLRENDADILLCDMQMPELNGVELMQSIHMFHEFLPIIAISGFDNFDYVRGSLVNRAENYLLKHELTREYLLSVLNEVKEKYRIVPEEKAVCRRIGYCFRDERDFTEQNILRLKEEGQISFECHNVVPIVVSPDYRLPEGAHPKEYVQNILNAFADILKQIIGQEYPYLICMTNRNHLLILMSFANMASSLFVINTLKNLTGQLQRKMIRMLDTTTTMLVGDIHFSLQKAVKEARLLENMMEEKLYLGGNRIVIHPRMSEPVYGKGEIPSALWKQLEFDLKHMACFPSEAVDEILEILEQNRACRESVCLNCRRAAELLAAGMEEEEKEAAFQRMDVYEIFGQFRNELGRLSRKRQELCRKNRPRYSLLIEQVVEYIGQNYEKDISLDSCAQMTGSSYAHLSREFKKETGSRFVEYLNFVRITKAKSLLIRNRLPMKEIAIKSGFRKYNYFFTVFKEVEGITPSEFAAKN